VHTPETHEAPFAQTFVQLPQLLTLLAVSRHAPSHTIEPMAQRQIPAEQVCPIGHAVPHAPQLVALPCKSTQALPHSVRRAAHEPPHLPAAQACPVAHAVPHAPQFLASFAVSTHAPLQLVVPAEHAHALP
jgi:hypothetical protein